MDWVDKPQNSKDLYGILQLLRFSHLNNFPLKTLKLGWIAFYSVTFQLKCLDFQSNQYKKLVPVLSRFCNGLWQAFYLLDRLALTSGQAFEWKQTTESTQLQPRVYTSQYPMYTFTINTFLSPRLFPYQRVPIAEHALFVWTQTDF